MGPTYEGIRMIEASQTTLPQPLTRFLVSIMMLILASCATPHREPTKEAPEATPLAVAPLPSMMSLKKLTSRYGYLPHGTNGAGRQVFRRGSSEIEIHPTSRVAYFDHELVVLDQSPHASSRGILVPRSLESHFHRPQVRPAVTKTKKPAKVRPIPARTLSGKHFVIDAGHGGRDHGASRRGVREKDVTLSISMEVARLLRQQGARVTMTRTNDRKIELNRRAQISNENRPDAFVSIHINSASNSGAAGAEVYPARIRSAGQRRDKIARSAKLARTILRQIQNVTPAKDRGIKRSPGFRVLKRNNHAAVLVELGFVTNSRERRLLGSPTYQRKLAQALVRGIREYARSI